MLHPSSFLHHRLLCSWCFATPSFEECTFHALVRFSPSAPSESVALAWLCATCWKLDCNISSSFQVRAFLPSAPLFQHYGHHLSFFQQFLPKLTPFPFEDVFGPAASTMPMPTLQQSCRADGIMSTEELTYGLEFWIDRVSSDDYLKMGPINRRLRKCLAPPFHRMLNRMRPLIINCQTSTELCIGFRQDNCCKRPTHWIMIRYLEGMSSSRSQKTDFLTKVQIKI